MSRNNLVSSVKKIVRFLLGVPITIAAFYFIGMFLWNARDEIEYSLANANYTLLLVGILFFILFFFLKNIIWIRILKNLGAKDIDTTKSFFLLSFSETKRYIPGSIFAYAARVKSYNDANIPSKLLVKSLIIDSLLLVIPSLIISIPGILFIFPRLQQQFPEYSQYILPATIGIFAFSMLAVVAAIVLAKKKLGVRSINIRDVVNKYGDLFFLSCLSWFFFGLANYLVASSIHVLDPKYILQFASFFVLSWFIGYISIVTPMGLGVREGIMILGLAPFAPLSVTSLIALFSRISFMAGEFLFLLVSFILFKSKYLQKWWKFAEKHAHAVILWIGIVSYIIYFSYVSIVKYLNFFMGKFDLGNMDQTVWNTLHGRIFMFTNPDSTENISRLAFHADFILILLSPLYLIWSDPRMLLILQTVVLGLGAYFVYKIGQHILKDNTISLIFAYAFLLNPLVQKQNLYDFHAVVLATTFLLAVWYFFIKKNLVWMTVFLILAVLTKENIYLITAIFGIFLITRKHFKLGSIITIVSITTFILLMKTFIPEARGGEHFAVSFLSEFGDSFGAAAITIITNPIQTIQVFFEHNGLRYLNMLLLPLGYLPFASPLYLLFAAPDIAKNTLADNPNFRSSFYQYNAEILPFLFISSIYGVSLLMKYFPKKMLVYYILIFSLIGTWLHGALPFGKSPYVSIYTNPRSDADQIRKFIAEIDEGKSVAATNNLGSHLSRRENIYVLPRGINEADMILLLTGDWYESRDNQLKLIEDLHADPNFKLYYQTGNFYGFERVKK